MRRRLLLARKETGKRRREEAKDPSSPLHRLLWRFLLLLLFSFAASSLPSLLLQGLDEVDGSDPGGAEGGHWEKKRGKRRRRRARGGQGQRFFDFVSCPRTTAKQKATSEVPSSFLLFFSGVVLPSAPSSIHDAASLAESAARRTTSRREGHGAGSSSRCVSCSRSSLSNRCHIKRTRRRRLDSSDASFLSSSFLVSLSLSFFFSRSDDNLL